MLFYMSLARQYASLIVGIAIPVFMIIAVAATIYLPRFLAHPSFDFVFTVDGSYSNQTTYFVNDQGKLQKAPIKPSTDTGAVYYSPPLPQILYLYDAQKSVVREISFDEASHLHINTASESPDGFMVTSSDDDMYNGIFPIIFGGNSTYNARYLTGHGYRLRVQIPDNGYMYSFTFLGWVTP